MFDIDHTPTIQGSSLSCAVSDQNLQEANPRRWRREYKLFSKKINIRVQMYLIENLI
jgi:adenosylmethionine-8-amino-7-oxononanoate aminotransferase